MEQIIPTSMTSTLFSIVFPVLAFILINLHSLCKLDVARTRIMSRTGADGIMSGQAGANREAGKEEKINVNTSNPITELLKIAESEGASSLFSGLLPRAVRALASGGIQFASYELTQNALLNR